MKKIVNRNESSLSYLPMHTAHVLSRPATLDRRIPMTILLCDALDGILSLNWCGFVDVEDTSSYPCSDQSLYIHPKDSTWSVDALEDRSSFAARHEYHNLC